MTYEREHETFPKWKKKKAEIFMFFDNKFEFLK